MGHNVFGPRASDTGDAMLLQAYKAISAYQSLLRRLMDTCPDDMRSVIEAERDRIQSDLARHSITGEPQPKDAR